MKKLALTVLLLTFASTAFAEEVVFNATASFVLQKTTYSSAKARRFFGGWPSVIPMDVTYHINKSTCSGYFQGTWSGQPISSSINPCVTASNTATTKLKIKGVSCSIRSTFQFDPIGDTTAPVFDSYGQFSIAANCNNGLKESARYGGGITYTKE